MSRNLELYIHIPFCVKKCNYCDFLSFAADEKTQQQYVNALIHEIQYYGRLMQDRLVSTIYFGGGTPSWLDSNLLVAILEQIKKSFSIADDAEVSMECNPGTITKEKMEAYVKAGINRLSIGLQSTDDKELQLLGRIHTYDQFLKTYEMARNAGINNINVDLISGLPYQTAHSFHHTLTDVIRMKPEHISSYSLIIEKGTPFYEQYKFDAVKQEAGIETEILPSEEEVYQMNKMTQRVLKEAGYQQYEISNYAKPHKECKHNIGYWNRTNYLGMGLGASSFIDNVRYRNLTDLHSYIKEATAISNGINGTNIETGIQTKELEYDTENGKRVVLGTTLHEEGQLLSRREQMEEFMFLGLRMVSGVSRDAFQNEFGISIESVYQDVLNELKAEGLLQVNAGWISLTEKGLDLSNYAMMKFLQ